MPLASAWVGGVVGKLLTNSGVSFMQEEAEPLLFTKTSAGNIGSCSYQLLCKNQGGIFHGIEEL